MRQVELAKILGVSKAYVSMILSGKKKPSSQIATRLKRLGIEVNSQVNFVAGESILNHARLPIPTLPLNLKSLNLLVIPLSILPYYLTFFLK
ncbi:helix-turn-helix domain-containing protein [Chloroflexota bacterium]